MLNCKEATRLMSESQDRTLRFTERMSLRFHTSMCRGCTNFGKQMQVLRQAARRYARAADQESSSRD